MSRSELCFSCKVLEDCSTVLQKTDLKLFDCFNNMCQIDKIAIKDLSRISILKNKYDWETSDNKYVMTLPPFT